MDEIVRYSITKDTQMNLCRLQPLLLCAVCAAFLQSAVAAPAAKKQPPKVDAVKLVNEGKTFLGKGQIEEALNAFRQAAKEGNIDGAFLAGDTLLTQAKNSTGRERILKGAESCPYLFIAATNLHSQACAELSETFLNGIGQQANQSVAYAWMKLATQRNAARKADLDQLAVSLDPNAVRQGQDLARDYLAGHWPTAIARPVDENDSRLKVQGVTLSIDKPLVVLNSATFAVGDTGEVRPANSLKNPAARKLSLQCIEIGADYVLVAVAGEPHLKLLPTDK
jgi:hypothetical protein